MSVLYAAIETGPLIAIVVTLIAAGVLGGAAAFRKAGRESQSIAARTLIEVNEHLREEVARVRKSFEQELTLKQNEIDELREEVGRLRGKCEDLVRSLDDLEHKLAEAQSTASSARARRDMQ